MQIQLKCLCGRCAEWALLEMQGSLEIQPAAQQALQNMVIGSLCRSSEETFIFTVGYHELEGKKVKLKKPLLVLRKSKPVDLMDIESPLKTPGKEFPTPQKQQPVEMEVIGVIRQKLLFKTRPKALISKPEVKPKKTDYTSGHTAV